MTSPCLHRVYSCGMVSPACKVGSGQLHVYIAVRYAMPSGSARRERDSVASQRRRHEGGSSQGVSGRRRDSVASHAEAMREARARRPQIADRSGSTVVHAPTYTQN